MLQVPYSYSIIILKGIVHPKMKIVIISSPSSCSKTVWVSFFCLTQKKFPIDTPLVLRLVKTHMGKCLFSPELKSYLITQWNCTTIGSCRCRKRTNGSAAELHEPMATIRANIPAETGGASGYISGRFAIGSSDFFSFSDDDFVYADPEKPTRRWHASQ